MTVVLQALFHLSYKPCPTCYTSLVFCFINPAQSVPQTLACSTCHASHDSCHTCQLKYRQLSHSAHTSRPYSHTCAHCLGSAGTYVPHVLAAIPQTLFHLYHTPWLLLHPVLLALALCSTSPTNPCSSALSHSITRPAQLSSSAGPLNFEITCFPNLDDAAMRDSMIVGIIVIYCYYYYYYNIVIITII